MPIMGAVGAMCPGTQCGRECAPVTLTITCYGAHATETTSDKMSTSSRKFNATNLHRNHSTCR